MGLSFTHLLVHATLVQHAFSCPPKLRHSHVTLLSPVPLCYVTYMNICTRVCAVWRRVQRVPFCDLRRRGVDSKVSPERVPVRSALEGCGYVGHAPLCDRPVVASLTRPPSTRASEGAGLGVRMLVWDPTGERVVVCIAPTTPHVGADEVVAVLRVAGTRARPELLARYKPGNLTSPLPLYAFMCVTSLISHSMCIRAPPPPRPLA